MTKEERNVEAKIKQSFLINEQVIFKWELTKGIPTAGRNADDEMAAQSMAASRGEQSCLPAASLQGKCPGLWVATHCWGIGALQERPMCHHRGPSLLESPRGKEAG